MPEIDKNCTWQQALSHLITDPKVLFELLNLDESLLPAAYEAAALFPLKVTHSFIERMERGNINDPLLQQVLPISAELQTVLGYELDPLAESQANKVPGLLHKYFGRVLITITSACAIHCRFCFRRHFPYAENNPGQKGWEKIFAYIRADQSIQEVILSGGDPLSVSNKLLTAFSNQLRTIKHVKRLRIHTRLPVLLPQRVDEGFVQWLQNLALEPIIVLHINHPHEIDAAVTTALWQLREAGVTLLNQSVLLRGINNQVETLIQLSERLFDAGVLPYYLHVLDKVQGTAHFDLRREEALQLHANLAKHLPGYLVPKLAVEMPGAQSKQVLTTDLYTD